MPAKRRSRYCGGANERAAAVGEDLIHGWRLSDISELLSMSRPKQNRCLDTPKRDSGADAFDDEDDSAWGLGRSWRQPRSGASDDWHNLFITKQLSATVTVGLILAVLMEVTVREMPHMVDREVLEVSNNKFNSLYEEPLASAQRKRWLNSIDFNPVGPFCAIACG